MSKNHGPDFQSIFSHMDEMIRQMDQFLAGPGLDDDSRHHYNWQGTLFPRWRQPPPLRHDDNEFRAPVDRSADDSLSPRDRLLKRPGEPPPRAQLTPRRDIDLDSDAAAAGQLLPSPPQLHDQFPGGFDFDGSSSSSSSSSSWFSSWSRVEHRVHQPDGTVKRTVTTVGPDGRRRSVTSVETPDGRVTDVQEEAADDQGSGVLTRMLRDWQHQQPRSESSPAPGAGGWGSWLFGPWFGGGANK